MGWNDDEALMYSDPNELPNSGRFSTGTGLELVVELLDGLESSFFAVVDKKPKEYNSSVHA